MPRTLPRPTFALPLLLALAGVGVGAATPASAQSPGVSRIAGRIDAYLRAAVRHDQFSGTILVAKRGVPLVRRGYGMASYELRVPNTPQSVFNIGSLTKQFTALAILQLRDQGRLALDHSICSYLDRCPASWQPVTLRHLLTHTSGIVNFSSLPGWDDSLSMRSFDRLAFVDVFRDQPLGFVPGEAFKYSNSG